MTDPFKPSEFDSAELEREQIENAEREARIELARREEILQWALKRAAELRQAEHEATLPKREPDRTYRRREVSHQGAERMSTEWTNYIRAQLDQQQRATLKAIAQVVGRKNGRARH